MFHSIFFALQGITSGKVKRSTYFLKKVKNQIVRR